MRRAFILGWKEYIRRAVFECTFRLCAVPKKNSRSCYLELKIVLILGVKIFIFTLRGVKTSSFTLVMRNKCHWIYN